jgi:hypothetical protein
VSVPAPLLGISARLLHIDPMVENDDWAASANNLVGTGEQSAVILYDVPTPGGEATSGERSGPSLANARGLHDDPEPMLVDVQLDLSTVTKGSLVIFPKVEIRWAGSPPYPLIQDTFLSLTNDSNSAVPVFMYFVNGDPPLVP